MMGAALKALINKAISLPGCCVCHSAALFLKRFPGTTSVTRIPDT